MKCPHCKDGKLLLKDVVTYQYVYDIADDGKVKWQDPEGYTSYLFIDREQTDFKQYVQCNECKKVFDHLIESEHDMDMIILKKAVHSNGPVSKDFFV
ncbi:hypothetical protein QBE52_05930 [Clostridiaceae bacterium 35-E11]